MNINKSSNMNFEHLSKLKKYEWKGSNNFRTCSIAGVRASHLTFEYPKSFFYSTFASLQNCFKVVT